MKELKQVEIKNGKLTLEGKVVAAELLKMVIIDLDFPDYLSLNELSLREKVMKEYGPEAENMKFKYGNMNMPKFIKKRRDADLERLTEEKHSNADAYVVGKEKKQTEYHTYYPVLYLKIKGENENEK